MEAELKILLAAVRQAGRIILELQNTFNSSVKKNNELVTEADLKVNDHLKQTLLSAFPNDGWLSEESIDDVARLQCDRVWVVDPIDGTKEYATGIKEYAVSVALIQNGQPIISTVFNPATDELFFAVKNNGAWLNDKRIYCNFNESERLTLLASRSEHARGEWQKFTMQDVKIVGSIAYKLALIAKGDAHATFSLSPKNEWDIAAGVLIVQEAGGIVVDQTSQAIQFNQANVAVNGIIAAASSSYLKVIHLIHEQTKNI